ncbi:lyase family protein [Conexivisphaera calida]|uniref:Adenylosuccinate lyase n=1 Tax=Conexivisphaera calida TaxID=1874277 RepID=A0A4P2VDG3_9ARCH|nr:lyase family protein [Conexivisphaera calida]BBE41872.1 Adenylosuccinate lyase [Conexivisphaera calida]
MADAWEPLSPLDGRYRRLTEDIARDFSEARLHELRVRAEVSYLSALVGRLAAEGLEAPLDEEERRSLAGLLRLKASDVEEIRRIEGRTSHDVAAVVEFLRSRVPPRLRRYVHLGLTSEDVNNLAYSALLEVLVKDHFAKEIANVALKLSRISGREACSVILGRTHGQPAVPTTLGRELGVHALRLARFAETLSSYRPRGKLGGAVGTLAALRLAYPSVDWRRFAREFVESLGFEYDEAVKQILPHDRESVVLYESAAACNAAVDMSVDVWLYLTLGYIRLEKSSPDQIGSSTMPQKVNPVDLEGGEGMLRFAARGLESMSHRLQESRLQRDISDSAVKRFYGEVYGLAITGLRRVGESLDHIRYFREGSLEDLNRHWEVLGEAAQVVLRSKGDDEGYEKVRRRLQGVSMREGEFAEAVRDLGPEISSLRPERYLGYACEQAAAFSEEAGRIAQGVIGSRPVNGLTDAKLF